MKPQHEKTLPLLIGTGLILVLIGLWMRLDSSNRPMVEAIADDVDATSTASLWNLGRPNLTHDVLYGDLERSHEETRVRLDGIRRDVENGSLHATASRAVIRQLRAELFGAYATIPDDRAQEWQLLSQELKQLEDEVASSSADAIATIERIWRILEKDTGSE